MSVKGVKKQNRLTNRSPVLVATFFTLMFSTALVNLIMVRQHKMHVIDASLSFRRLANLSSPSSDATTFTDSSSSSSSSSLSPHLTARLPSNYRKFDQHQCRHASSVKYAPVSSEPKISLDQQRNLAGGGYLQIAQGSGIVTAAGLIVNVLSCLQHNQGIYGTLAELGVHHGRFTSFLFATARQSEQLVAADLFANQDQNVDFSGHGDYKQFVRGLKSYGLLPTDLQVLLSGSTSELPLDWSSVANFHPFRIISVDASHTAEYTYNDLSIAFCNLLKGGVVILDDWFHAYWPGVVEGYYQFVTAGPVEHVYPFLICESKLYLTNDLESHQHYYNALLQDETLQPLMRQYSFVKRRGKVYYEMNGVHYLKCVSRDDMNVTQLQDAWVERVF